MDDPFMRDTFAAEWDKVTDADPTDDADFLYKAEAAGLVELVPVDADALDSPFADELGIEAGGMMYVLTAAGRVRYLTARQRDQQG